jgi:hypothetical protein
MAKLPAFQFYPGDWRKDVGVQSLDYFDRGVWHEMLCLMHESERRGVLVLNGKAMPDEGLARLLGLDKQKLTTTLTTLLTSGVASREPETGAVFCRRMVRDERLREVRAEAGKMGGNPVLLNQKSTTGDKQKSTPSSSSSSSISFSTATAKTNLPEGAKNAPSSSDGQPPDPTGTDSEETKASGETPETPKGAKNQPMVTTREKPQRDSKPAEQNGEALETPTGLFGEAVDPTGAPGDRSSLRGWSTGELPRQLDKALREVFAYYLATMRRNPKTYTFSPLRRHKGEARLEEALRIANGNLENAVVLMKAVVDEVALSDWHMGRDPKTGGRAYCEWESNLFRSTEQFEQWLQKAQKAGVRN